MLRFLEVFLVGVFAWKGALRILVSVFGRVLFIVVFSSFF